MPDRVVTDLNPYAYIQRIELSRADTGQLLSEQARFIAHDSAAIHCALEAIPEDEEAAAAEDAWPAAAAAAAAAELALAAAAAAEACKS